MIKLIQTSLQTLLKDFLSSARTVNNETDTAQISPCNLKRDHNLGKTIVFQIDPQSLQYCISQRGVTSNKLIDFGKIYRPRTTISLTEHAPFLREEIQRLFKQYNFTGARFGLCLSSSEVAVRTFTIPKMSKHEERSAVYFQGDKTVPFSLDDSYWSYRRCETIKTSTSCDVSITLMANLKSALQETLQFFDSCGIEFDFICQDVEALGLSLSNIADFDNQTPFGLLNIRPSRTDISLYHGARLKFLHHGAIGSIALGQSLQLKSSQSHIAEQTRDNFAEGLANVIQQALDFYGANHGVDEIETFYIYGDISYSDELIEALSKKFGVIFKRFPIEVFDNIALDDLSLKETIPVALPAIASAVSPYQLSDFTPTSLIQKKDNHTFKRRALAAAALAIITLTVHWSYQWQRNSIADNALMQANTTVQRFEQSVAYAGYRILKEELMRQEQIIDQLENNNSEHYLALKEIAALTPNSVKLNYLQYYPKEKGIASTLTGEVTSYLAAPEVILAEYTTRLDGSPLFQSAKLKTHNKSIDGNRRTVTFTIDLNAAL